jgi:uncharacterized protein YjbJ (UPF0337 family)
LPGQGDGRELADRAAREASTGDVKTIAGKKSVLLGKLQERCGILQDDAEKQADEWLANFSLKKGKKS